MIALYGKVAHALRIEGAQKFPCYFLQSVPLVKMSAVIVFKTVSYLLQLMKEGVWVYFVITVVCVFD